MAAPTSCCRAALLQCFLEAASGPVTLTEASAHFLPSVLSNLGVDRWPQLRCVGLGTGGQGSRVQVAGFVEPWTPQAVSCSWAGCTPRQLHTVSAACHPPSPKPSPYLNQTNPTRTCRELLGALVASEYVSVRVTLAERLHELLGMLGPQRVDDELLAMVEVRWAWGRVCVCRAVQPQGSRASTLHTGVECCMQSSSHQCLMHAPSPQRLSADDNQAVADALAMNIHALLSALPPHGRLAQLAFLSRMHPEDGSSCGQWRMRLLIAEQLAGVAALLGRQGLAEVLLPATLRLCEDPVAAVREAAAAQLGCMVRSLLAEMGEQGGSQGGSAAQQPAAVESQQEDSNAGGAASDAAAGQSAPGQQGNEQGQQQDEASQGQQEDQPPPQQASQPEQQQPDGGQQAQQASQPAAVDDQDELELEPDAARQGDPAAVVQQIVQHLVELQRSSGHRSRQTYLAFCAALLLPQPVLAPATPQPGPDTPQLAGGSPLASDVAAAVAASPGKTAAADPAAPAAEPSWPQLPAAIVESGITQGLLEGAVALAFDPVPNVRLGVARLLAALRRQQPALAGRSPQVIEALAALKADGDRDVQAAAAGDC